MADEALAPTDGSSPEETVTPTEETLESLNPEVPEEKSETVPLKKYMEEKRSAKEAEARAEALATELAKVKSNITEMSVPAVNDALVKLAETHDVSPEFLAQFMALAETTTAAKIREELSKEYDPKIAQIEQERQADTRDKKFNDLYSKLLASAPEYDGIVNKDVLKSLALNPANAKKTLSQIAEEAYGNAVKGSKSIESHSPGSRGGDEVDLSNPTDADFDKINADPTLKKQWAAQAEAQIRQYL